MFVLMRTHFVLVYKKKNEISYITILLYNINNDFNKHVLMIFYIDVQN